MVFTLFICNISSHQAHRIYAGTGEEILNGGRGWASNGGNPGGRACSFTVWLVDGQRGRVAGDDFDCVIRDLA